MDVLLNDIRKLKVYNSFDAWNIEASCSNIGRQQNVDFLFFEASKAKKSITE